MAGTNKAASRKGATTETAINIKEETATEGTIKEGATNERPPTATTTKQDTANNPQNKPHPQHSNTNAESSDSEDSASSSSAISTSSSDASSSSDSGTNHPPPTLQSRLAAFLPQIARSNETLTESSRIDNVDDGEERYIQMDLGLGVFSERAPGEDGEIKVKESDEESGSDETENSDGDVTYDELMSGKIGNRRRSESVEQPKKRRKIEEVS